MYPTFATAEAAYRRERIAEDYRRARRVADARPRWHVPAVRWHRAA